jgi:hypothetical protein
MFLNSFSSDDVVSFLVISEVLFCVGEIFVVFGLILLFPEMGSFNFLVKYL